MMQQEFKMNNGKKMYCKPTMEVVEMDYRSNLLDGSCCTDAESNDDVLESGFEG